MKTRNTRQSAIILDVLANDKSHPSIKELVEKVSLVDPSLGQATVYRNVSKLVNNNLIKKIPTFNGDDRYDGDISNHFHLQCEKCGKLVDIFYEKMDNLITDIELTTDMEITSHLFLFTGICDDCKNKNKKEG